MATIRTIAVGVDGSPDAERAVRWAAGLAAPLGAVLAVVHAAGLLEAGAGAPPAAALEARVVDLATAEGLAVGSVRWHRADGDPCSVLLRSAEPPISADLLVVGSRGRGGHSGLLLGSTSLQLAERSPVPVVIVPSPG